jgi:phage repressor protein C with HTH and peptisase S24 domain
MKAIERLYQYIDYKGYKPTIFEKDIGLSSGYLSVQRKRNADIGETVVNKINDNCQDLSIEWLITGKGSMLRTDQPIEAIKIENETSDAYPLIDLFAAAGFGSVNFGIEKKDVKEYYIIPKFQDLKIDFMIEVTGSSMYPKYSSGDIIACTIIRESKFIQWNKVHVIATTEQGLLVKRIREHDDHSILAISDNTDYPPFKVPLDEITGIALVVGVIRLV